MKDGRPKMSVLERSRRETTETTMEEERVGVEVGWLAEEVSQSVRSARGGAGCLQQEVENQPGRCNSQVPQRWVVRFEANAGRGRSKSD